MSLTTRDTAELLALQRKIVALSPADRLVVAAECVRHQKYEIAETIAGAVVDELRALRLLRNKAARAATPEET